MSSKKKWDSVQEKIKRDTPEIFIQSVLDLASKNGYYKEIEEMLEYFSPSGNQRALSDYAFNFCAVVKPGTNEGTLIETYLEGAFDQSGETRLSVATFKTLSTDIDTFSKLGAFCGVLSYYAGEYINQNIKKYSPAAL